MAETPEQIHEAVENTKRIVWNIITQKEMTDAHLEKPPYRYVFDLIRTIQKKTGFAPDLFVDDELDSGKPQPKDLSEDKKKELNRWKASFLQKSKDIACKIMGQELKFEPKNVLAGKEVVQTNKLLVLFAQAASKPKDDKEDKELQKKQSDPTPKNVQKTQPKTKPESQTKPKAITKNPQKKIDEPDNKQEKDQDQQKKKEKEQPKKKNDEDIEDRLQSDPILNQPPTQQPQQQYQPGRPMTAKKAPPKNAKIVTNTDQSDTNLITTNTKDGKLKNTQSIGAKKKSSSLDDDDDNEGLFGATGDDKQDNQRRGGIRDSESRRGGARRGGISGKVIKGNKQGRDADDGSSNESEDDILIVRNQGDGVQRGKEKKSMLAREIDQQNKELHGTDDDQIGDDGMKGKNGKKQGDKDQNEDDKKKTSKREDQVSSIRDGLQAIVKAAMPLGRVDFIQADLEVIQAEYDEARKENLQHISEISKLERESDEQLHPLMAQLCEVDQKILDIKRQIYSQQAQITRNDIQINNLLRNIMQPKRS